MNHIEVVIFFILSIGVFGGMLGGYLFQKLRIPQVVGYIVIGVMLGETGLGIVKSTHITRLCLFNYFALGVIGFLVGGELKIDNFKKYGKQYLAILCGEGLTAFILVSAVSSLVFYLVLQSFSLALAGGIVLGAIASATDPASTIDVLWEYRSKGILTTAVIAIVALDDALAMVLYGIGTGVSRMLTTENSSILANLTDVLIDLGGACVLGAVAAAMLAWLLRLMDKAEKGTALSLGVIMLVITAAISFKMDLILAAMTLGFVLTNLTPRRSHDVFELMRGFSIPIYAIFFVLVGARLKIAHLPGWLWMIVILYVLGRSIGKYTGSWFGAKITGAPASVRKYLGSSLFAQGGVAIGLTIVASQSLSNIMITENLSLGAAIICVVTTTTLIVQLIGPSATKFSIIKAGEINRDLTEEDVLKSSTVADIKVKDYETLSENLPIAEVVKKLQNSRQLIHPVIDDERKVQGTIGMESLKDIIADPEEWNWLIVSDIVQPLTEYCHPDSSLQTVYSTMLKTGLNQLPIMNEDRSLVGILDIRDIRNHVRGKMLTAYDDDGGLKPATINGMKTGSA